MESIDPEKDVWRKQWNEGKERQRWILQNGYGSRRQNLYRKWSSSTEHNRRCAAGSVCDNWILRRADPERIELLFAEAYQADPLFALKNPVFMRVISGKVSARDVSFGFYSILPSTIRRRYCQPDLIGVSAVLTTGTA